MANTSDIFSNCSSHHCLEHVYIYFRAKIAPFVISLSIFGHWGETIV